MDKDEKVEEKCIITKVLYICPTCNRIVGTSDDGANYFDDVKECKFCGQKFFVWIDHFPMQI